MKQTPYSAFGYIILRNECDVGDIINDAILKNNVYSVLRPSHLEDGNYSDQGCGYSFLYCAGKLKVTNIYSGAVEERTAGWSNINQPEKVGFYLIEFLEPFVGYCISPNENAEKKPKIPNTSVFSLKAGESTTLSVGTNLFFGYGKLKIGTKEVSNPGQVTISTNDVLVEALEDSYGLFFL